MKIILFFLSFLVFFQTNADVFIPWANCNNNFDQSCFDKCVEKSGINWPNCDITCCYSEPKIVHDNLVLISIIALILLSTIVFFQFKRKQKLKSNVEEKND